MHITTYAKTNDNNNGVKLLEEVTISKEEKEWVANLSGIKFLAAQAPPMSMTSNNNEQQSGIGVDVISFIAEQLGLKYSLQNNTGLSLINSIKAVQNGEYDDFLPLSKNPEREKLGLFSQPFYSSVYAIISKEGSGFFIKNFNDLKRYKIGYFKGFVLEEQLKQIVPEEQLYPIFSDIEEDIYDAIYDNKVDIIIHNKDMFNEHKYSHQHFDLNIIFSLYDYPRQYGFYFHKNPTNEKLLELFDRYIVAMDVSGSYNKHQVGEKKLIQEYISNKNKQLIVKLLFIFIIFVLITIVFFYRKNIKIARKLYQTNLKLQNLYGTDTLTSLPNRSKLDEVLKKEYSNYIKTKSALSVLFIDADFFKKINDTYGHDVGDKYLIKMAEALRKSVMKTSGFVARYGGEEFICLIPNSSHELAMKIANKIQEEVALLGNPPTKP